MVSISEQAIARAGQAGSLIKRISQWLLARLRKISWSRKTSASTSNWVTDRMPKGLFARALIIIIAPIVILESVVAFVFMERHWETVTRRLSEATSRDIATLIAVYEANPRKEDQKWLIALSREKLNLSVQILPLDDLPPARPKPFFSLLDRTLSNEIRKVIARPFWIDTVGRSNLVEIRVKLDNAVFRVIARRSQTYASNSHIFLVWMLVTSLILLTVAILFLRNQIKPILRLADAAESFGKGRPIPDDFTPRGAREVRRAATAFIEMSNRIERHVEQRTTMLAGVSHDLRTILTRFKLQLAMFGDSPETKALYSDADEMQHMLEDYLSFAKGDGGEVTVQVEIEKMLEELCADLAHHGKDIKLTVEEGITSVPLRRQAFKRAIANMVGNSVRYADQVTIKVGREDNWLKVEIDDNGPGIPADKRDEVFRPFYRIDTARNQDQPNTGLGLAIALDIIRGHGGDIQLDESSLGGLRAVVLIPL